MVNGQKQIPPLRYGMTKLGGNRGILVAEEAGEAGFHLGVREEFLWLGGSGVAQVLRIEGEQELCGFDKELSRGFAGVHGDELEVCALLVVEFDVHMSTVCFGPVLVSIELW